MKLYEVIKPKIYLDLDSTVIDFRGGSNKLLDGNGFGQGRKTIDVYKDAFAADPKWYENLPWMPGGKAIWNRIKNEDVTVLTAVGVFYRQQIIKQKYGWVKKNLSSSLSVKIVTDGNKGRHAKPGDILIDDDPKYLRQWDKAGGIAIQANKALSELSKLDI